LYATGSSGIAAVFGLLEGPGEQEELISMTNLARICVAALILVLPRCFAQTAPAAHHTKKPEPTRQELFDYVRGKLLALSPSDGINDNLEVAFDPATSTLSITQPDGRCDIFLNSVDTNSTLWDVFDPSDSYHTREDVLRLTVTSLSGKKARTCYDKNNQVDTSIASNRARLLFSVPKANAVPKFAETMGKAIKKLIVLSGGSPEKDLF
jgi:hypothetical protein